MWQTITFQPFARMSMRATTPEAFEITQEADCLTLHNDRLWCCFNQDSAGMPTTVGFPDESPIFIETMPLLRAQHVTRGELLPHLATWQPRLHHHGRAIHLCFDDVTWNDAKGRIYEDLRLALIWDIYPEGVVFVEMQLAGNKVAPQSMTSFRLSPKIQLRPDQDATWSYWKRPSNDDATIIQALGECERMLSCQDQRVVTKSVLPYTGVAFGRGDCRDHHIEFFLENGNSVTPDPQACSTELKWEDQTFRVNWEFCSGEHRPRPGRAWAWRNVWGFCLTRMPQQRRRAPYRVVHHLDNFDRLPTSTQLKQMAEHGADLLILHENWRLTMPDGAVPYDPPGLRQTIDSAHRLGLRVALYARGNEQAIREQIGRSHMDHLQPNHDGIYLDYGSPICYQSKNESAPAGRIHFREYFQVLRQLRRRVGPDGVLITHAGPFPAALGHVMVDAYLGGEQEKGRLFENPTAHAVFSSLSHAPAALWTAAFPSYRDPKILPDLVRSLQTPFVHLGTQVPSSSLTQPHNVNEANFARTFWRLLELCDGQNNLRFYSTLMSDSLLTVSPDSAACSCLITVHGDVLFLLGNASGTRKTIHAEMNWESVGMNRPPHGWALDFQNGQPTANSLESTAPSELDLAPGGIGAVLWSTHRDEWAHAVERFLRPWPALQPADKKRQQQIESLRQRRFDPPPRDAAYIRVRIPNWPNTYEDSLWTDLFQNDLRLVLAVSNTLPVTLGIVTTTGLTQGATRDAERLWPGMESPWMALHPYLKSCNSREAIVRIQTFRQNEPFYSFIEVDVAENPDDLQNHTLLRYDIAIDQDWSCLDFLVRLK
jgi:hypothetical protein